MSAATKPAAKICFLVLALCTAAYAANDAFPASQYPQTIFSAQKQIDDSVVIHSLEHLEPNLISRVHSHDYAMRYCSSRGGLLNVDYLSDYALESVKSFVFDLKHGLWYILGDHVVGSYRPETIHTSFIDADAELIYGVTICMHDLRDFDPARPTHTEGLNRRDAWWLVGSAFTAAALLFWAFHHSAANHWRIVQDGEAIGALKPVSYDRGLVSIGYLCLCIRMLFVGIGVLIGKNTMELVNGYGSVLGILSGCAFATALGFICWRNLFAGMVHARGKLWLFQVPETVYAKRSFVFAMALPFCIVLFLLAVLPTIVSHTDTVRIV